MTIELDANQTEFMDVLAQNEMKMNRGGIVTIVEDDFRIEEIMLSHIVRRKAMNEKTKAPQENTLIVAPYTRTKKWRQRIEQFNDTIPILFYKKGCTDSQKVLCNEVIITSFCELFDLKEQEINYWKRIVLYDSTNITEKYTPTEKQFKRLYKIEAPYRWCITSDPAKHYLAELFYIGKNGRDGYSIDDCLKQKRVDFFGFSPMMTHEDYIENADAAAKQGNMIQFSNNLWNAVFSFTNSFYVKTFNMNAESYDNLEKRFEAFCAGLTPSDVADLMRLWVNAEWNYLECDQDNFFISKKNMEGIVEQLKKSIGLIQKADISLIGNALGFNSFPEKSKKSELK